MENDYWLLIASLKKEYFNRKKTVISRFQISSAELDIYCSLQIINASIPLQIL